MLLHRELAKFLQGPARSLHAFCAQIVNFLIQVPVQVNNLNSVNKQIPEKRGDAFTSER